VPASLPGKKELERLTWRKIFSPATSERYLRTTNTIYVLDGLKILCDSGRVEAAYLVVEEMLGKQLPVLMGHLDWIPLSCQVMPAQNIFDYEEQGFIISFIGHSMRSGGQEMTCIFFDDGLYYARICTRNEVEKIWQIIAERI